MNSATTKWSAVVITNAHQAVAKLICDFVSLQFNFATVAPDTLLLPVEDPHQPVGSGGATINALLVAVEHLSARAGYTVVNADVLADARVLIIQTSCRVWDPLGPALIHFLSEATLTKVDSLVNDAYRLITNCLSVGAPAGVWACSTDMFLSRPWVHHRINWSRLATTGAVAFSALAPMDVAVHHGVFKTSSTGILQDILYKACEDKLAECKTPEPVNQLPLIAGIVFFGTHLADKLLQFHGTSPLDSCTYMGVDAGGRPLQVSLFLDILLCLAEQVSESEFHSRAYQNHRPQTESPEALHHHKQVCAATWKLLRGAGSVSVEILPETAYHHISSPDDWRKVLLSPGSSRVVSNNQQQEPPRLTASILTNSECTGSLQLGSGSVVVDSKLTGDWIVGNNSVIADVFSPLHSPVPHRVHNDIYVAERILQPCHDNGAALTVAFGMRDRQQLRYDADGATFCGRPWSVLFAHTGIRPEDLWDLDSQEVVPCLATARLFATLEDALWLQAAVQADFDISLSIPKLRQWLLHVRFSLDCLHSGVNLSLQLKNRRDRYFRAGFRICAQAIPNAAHKLYMLPFFDECARFNQRDIFRTLDAVAASAPDEGTAARVFAAIAEVLGSFGMGRGGLRSGPAGHIDWLEAFELLELRKLPEGVAALAKQRDAWLTSPVNIIRAARHYERAAQIMIRLSVMTAQTYVDVIPNSAPALAAGQWVVARASARMDLAGGWTDTPPIAYEHGGIVVNVAFRVDNQYPIMAKARRIVEPQLVLVLLDNEDQPTQTVVCTVLSDLHSYLQPNSPAALLKAAFICAGVIKLGQGQPRLEEQLQAHAQVLSDGTVLSGFELRTASNLPQGSGLGTSSILAGAILAALWRSTGVEISAASLNHAVLHLEQLLTTGGGWQDQVGGLMGDVKVATSEAKLPLEVKVETIALSRAQCETLSSHMVLVYTGKTRLARNLLQGVVRNWYARMPELISIFDDLKDNARRAADAMRRFDLPVVGHCLTTYWEQKRAIAPGSEPALCRKIFDAVAPHSYGYSLAGAGGGGFMVVLTKAPNQHDIVRECVSQLEEFDSLSFHTIQIDPHGMHVTVE